MPDPIFYGRGVTSRPVCISRLRRRLSALTPNRFAMITDRPMLGGSRFEQLEDFGKMATDDEW